MTILLSRLNDRITQGATTTIHVPGRTKTYNPAGKLFQNFLGSRIVHNYDYSHGVRSQADLQAIIDAFYVCMMNGYEGLLHKDWRDFIATLANSTCSVIDSTHVQLQRIHSFGAAFYYRDITKPCASPAAVVYRTRAGVQTVASSSVDTATGIATISTHVAGDTYAWQGQFDVPVAWTDDDWVMDIETGSANMFLTSEAIKLEEILS